MMIFIAVAAVDLAASLAFLKPSNHFNYDLARYFSVAPMILALEFSALQLIQVRGPARYFWGGFMVIGLAIAMTRVLAYVDPSFEKITIHADGSTTEEFHPGGPAARAWGAYSDIVYEIYRRLIGPFPLYKTGCFVDAGLACVPQFLLSGLAGILACESSRWGLRRSRPSAPSADRSPNP